MAVWPKDNQAARNAFYGDPSRGEIARQMVAVVPPFAVYYEGRRVPKIMFHRKAAPALQAALNEIWDYCQRDQTKIDAAGVSKFAGAYNHRMVRGSATKWSNHAYAAAIDLNAGENALGVRKGTMPQFVVDAFCRQGAMWGGWYSSRPDWMHFEFVDNGGRKPKSPPPVWPPVARLFDDPDTEAADEPLADDHVGSQAYADIVAVQARLKAMNYNPGIVEGSWGGMLGGAIAGFLNDRHSALPAPTSAAAFAAIKDQLDAELDQAEAEGFVRPVSAARAAADDVTVAKVAPEVVPVKRNFLAAAWAFVLSMLTAVWNTVSGAVLSAWNFFTDHKDSLPSDPGLLQTAWNYLQAVPPAVWILAVAAMFAFIALNSRNGVKAITESVQSGARQ